MASATKTREEIEALKRNWANDPCYAIEYTQGFEAHIDELRAYRLVMEARWEAARIGQLEAKAEELGCPGNLALAAYIERLEGRIYTLEHHRV